MMTALPAKYMRIAFDLTGYSGTYLPSATMTPGMIGRAINGTFVRDDDLTEMPGYDPKRHATQEQPKGDPVTVWSTRNVVMTIANSEANAPGGARGGIGIRFGAADEAAIICHGCRTWSFRSQQAIRDLMHTLYKAGKWTIDQCVVTDVLLVDSAWICFSTAKGQAASIQADAALPLPLVPKEALTAIGGNAKLVAGVASDKAAGFYTTLPSGGSPLFRAIRFNKDWFGGMDGTVVFNKGPSPKAAFEDATFG